MKVFLPACCASCGLNYLTIRLTPLETAILKDGLRKDNRVARKLLERLNEEMPKEKGEK